MTLHTKYHKTVSLNYWSFTNFQRNTTRTVSKCVVSNVDMTDKAQNNGATNNSMCAFFAVARVALIPLYSQTCKKVISDCHQKHTNLQQKPSPSISLLTTLPRCIFSWYPCSSMCLILFFRLMLTSPKKIKSSCFDMNLQFSALKVEPLLSVYYQWRCNPAVDLWSEWKNNQK